MSGRIQPDPDEKRATGELSSLRPWRASKEFEHWGEGDCEPGTGFSDARQGDKGFEDAPRGRGVFGLFDFYRMDAAPKRNENLSALTDCRDCCKEGCLGAPADRDQSSSLSHVLVAVPLMADADDGEADGHRSKVPKYLNQHLGSMPVWKISSLALSNDADDRLRSLTPKEEAADLPPVDRPWDIYG
ncbi:hypothetical protein Nepgr_018705 [Nepenthes gracilis]|uniref:Uncharacterized protein n=1 Tax=Nepenthes gracilis TaxID=150966 RepID=A0AAD3SUC4_NEPGR|nr:hypothetical protein Nepgr_018705 [Nepenthes gracilis]